MELFPPLPLAEWRDTKETLHRFEQLIGKIRLTSSPRRNHWWHVPFHVTGRGITTRPMGQSDGNPVFTIDFDFVDHQLVVTTLDGTAVSFPLLGQSVASFREHTLATLADLGVHAEIPHPEPFDLPDSSRPFSRDTEHATYDPEHANRYWQVLSQVALVLEEFAAGFSGKSSAVHHFWHTFDIAHTRFSGRHVEQSPQTDPVTREAYSEEVTSFGFWFGDEKLPEPAFYAYAAPEPPGLEQERLSPSQARWAAQNGGHLALLMYDDARAQPDPRSAVLDFYGSAYRAAAVRADWDVDYFASPHGVTDRQLLSRHG